jgi:dTDP-glucose pyrophosphorylase
MTSWESILIPPELPLREAMLRIDERGTKLALVVDGDRRLLGTVSDGDIRRGLLGGMELSDPVERCMCPTPTTASEWESKEAILLKMRGGLLHQIPIVDSLGRVVDLKTIDDYLAVPDLENWVVIMAGGLGTRLKELTQQVPKSLLAIGNRPLLETVVRRFVGQGFRNIWLAVNHQADKIEGHIGDGSALGARVRYLRERRLLGTAGALSLLPQPIERPVLVTNADVLTTVDYCEMLEVHTSADAVATMAVREYEYQIPFGVLEINGERIVALQEKPVHQSLVNAGIYVLSPEAIARVPGDTEIDMPDLFGALIADGLPVRSHRVRGYWLDVGRQEDLQKANLDFPQYFQ